MAASGSVSVSCARISVPGSTNALACARTGGVRASVDGDAYSALVQQLRLLAPRAAADGVGGAAAFGVEEADADLLGAGTHLDGATAAVRHAAAATPPDDGRDGAVLALRAAAAAAAEGVPVVDFAWGPAAAVPAPAAGPRVAALWRREESLRALPRRAADDVEAGQRLASRAPSVPPRALPADRDEGAHRRALLAQLVAAEAWAAAPGADGIDAEAEGRAAVEGKHGARELGVTASAAYQLALQALRTPVKFGAAAAAAAAAATNGDSAAGQLAEWQGGEGTRAHVDHPLAERCEKDQLECARCCAVLRCVACFASPGAVRGRAACVMQVREAVLWCIGRGAPRDCAGAGWRRAGARAPVEERTPRSA